MSPKNFTASTPTTLGAALLALSGALFAVDVGGTYALNADDANLDAAAPLTAPAVTATAVAAIPLEPQDDRAAAPPLLTTHKVSTPIRVEHARTAIAKRPAPQRRRRESRAIAARRITAVKSGLRKHAAVPVIVAEVPSAVRTSSEHAAARSPHARPLATLREVRRYVMHALANKYKQLCVVSATTYSRNGRVLVDLVLRAGDQVWYENDVVKRTGMSLTIASRDQHVLPRIESKPSPVLEPESLSGET